MKSPNFILRVLVTAIIGILVWWFLRPTPKTQEKTAAAYASSNVAAPKPLAPPQIAKPLASPVKVNSQTTTSAPPVAAPAEADPQADLKTAIPDIVRLFRAGDDAAFEQTYTPPDKLDPERIQQLQAQQQQIRDMVAQDPRMLPMMQSGIDTAAQSYEALETQTPTFNASGDEATYMLTRLKVSNGKVVLGDTQIPMTFVKINGKWYWKGGDRN